MTLEGHTCWEDCDEGPHGCVCGNDCEPPRWSPFWVDPDSEEDPEPCPACDTTLADCPMPDAGCCEDCNHGANYPERTPACSECRGVGVHKMSCSRREGKGMRLSMRAAEPKGSGS